jgi:hypothetical protein
MTFRVDGAVPAPGPTATPRVEPSTQAPAAPPASQAKPAGAAPAAIRIETRQARLVRGTLRVRLKCSGPAGRSCGGRLILTAKHGKRTVTLASASYRVTAGRTSTVRLRPRHPLPHRVTAVAGTARRTITVR